MCKIKYVKGYGKFIGVNILEVKDGDDVIMIIFDKVIIVVGFELVSFLFIFEDDCVIDLIGVLEMKDILEKMLVLGGGIIGLEMGIVYEVLGLKIDVVEFLDQLILVVDKDIMKVFMKDYKDRFNIMLEIKVIVVEVKDDGLYVIFEGKKVFVEFVCYDKVLVVVGCKLNGKLVGVDIVGVNVDECGFINVDK